MIHYYVDQLSTKSVRLDQSNPCTQIYLQKNSKLHKLAVTNSSFEKIDYFRHASSYNV